MSAAEIDRASGGAKCGIARPSPVRRDREAAEPDAFDPERAGVDRRPSVPRLLTRKTSSAKPGMMVPSIVAARATRRTMPSSSGSTAIAPAPCAAAPSSGRLCKQGFVLFRSGVASPPAWRIGAGCSGCRSGGLNLASGRQGEHRRDRAHRFGEFAARSRQACASASASGARKVGQLSRDLWRREPVRLGEQDVDARDARVPLGDPAYEFGDQAARPRPLAILREALSSIWTITIGEFSLGARQQPLLEIENAQPQLLDDAGSRTRSARATATTPRAAARARSRATGRCPTASAGSPVRRSAPARHRPRSPRPCRPSRLISSNRTVSAKTPSILRVVIGRLVMEQRPAA